MSRIHFLASGASLLVAIGSLAASAEAQLPQSDVAASRVRGAGQLQDIIVTAQRRPEKLQDTALAATALVAEDLIGAGKITIASALTQTPSVRVQGASNGAQIYIRGVGSNADSQLGDPAVNLNIDGIYQQETEAVVSGLYDLDRIEILRGPQGTLYGRNATAGAVNVITRDPMIGDMSGAMNAQYGNYDALNVDGNVNLGLSEATAVRAAMSYQRRDGYLSNSNNDLDSLSGRVKFLLEPGTRFRLVVGANYSHIADNGFGTVEAPLERDDPYASAKPQGYRKIDAWGINANADYSLDWVTLSLVAGHTDFRKTEANVLLGLAPAVADRRTGELTSTELRLTSDKSSPVKWTVGAFYLDNKEVRKVIASPISVPEAPASDPELQDATTQSYAVFANVTVPVTEKVRFTGGLRYTRDRKTARYIFADGITEDARVTESWNSVTYKVGAEADLAPDSLLYAQISSGFKAGGFAQQYPAASYDPEKLTAYEIGSKNEFWDHRLRLNLSAFHYSYRNYQASYPDIVGGAFALVTSNAATAKLHGAEAELTFLPTQHDTLNLSASYLHSRFGQFIYSSVLSGTVDHSNERLPSAPQWSADLSYEHRFELGDGAMIKAHVNTHLSSGYWTTVERTTDAYQPSFTRTDAFLMYQPASEAWNIRLFVNNLENKAVRTLGLQNPFDAVLMLAPPRTYGVGASLKF